MTFSEVIKLTAVPNGVDTSSNTFYLSVLISPELSGGSGTLADTDFENWPETLMGFSQQENNDDGNYSPAYWDVVVSDSGGNTLQQSILPLDASQTNAELWASLFPPSTSYEQPASSQSQSRSLAKPQDQVLVDDTYRAIPIISYPATQIIDFVTGQYQQYSPTEVPSFELISSVYASVTEGLIGVVGQNSIAAQARERQARSRGNSVPHANDFTSASTAEAYAAFAAYQQASNSPAPPAGVGTIDFHAALAYIGQHGVLQRALALVFDIGVPYGQAQFFTGTDINSDLYVSVSLKSSGNGSSQQPASPQGVIAPSGSFGFTQVSPRTQCDANSTTFTAHSSTGSISNGLRDGTNAADLKPIPMSIVGDVNATSTLPFKLRTIQRAQAAKGDYASGDSEDYTNLYVPPPSLRSAGLTLAQVGAGLTLAEQLVRAYAAADAASTAVNSGDGSQLSPFVAEDLVRGYVLDVQDVANGVWRSTCERNVTYTSGSTSVSGPTSDPFDEAPVQAVPRIVNPPDVGSEQFVLSEILLSYTGWSNAVARPGTPLADSDSALSAGAPPYDLTVDDSVPPGRLAPLRFGHTYRLRVRTVDVANNKVDVSDPANDRLYTDQITYGRLEPIPSPDIYPQSLPRLGESLKRLVIRDVDIGTPSLRALYPQRVSGQFAEAHGMFDTSSGDPDPAAYATIVPRETGQYPAPPQPPDDASTVPPTIALDQPVPFLPDPLARGAVLTVVVPDTQQSFNIDFSPPSGAAWPDYRPFGLEVTAGPAFGASVDADRRVITFTLTPADDVTVSLGTTCAAGDVPLLGMPQLFQGTPDAGQVAAGAYWSVSPKVNLQLTYAVQLPLATPELQGLYLNRDAGDTVAPIIGNLAWSPKSTVEVDIVAAWSEPVDDSAANLLQGPGAPDPTLRQVSNSPVATVSVGNTQLLPYPVRQQPDDGDQGAATDPLSFNHQFFDTKHRVVTYSGVASSAFAECYPDGTPITVTSATPATVNVLSSAKPEPPSITDVIPIYEWDLTDASGKLTSRRAPSALRVFIARPWWSSGIGELLGVLTSASDETDAAFTIAPNLAVSDWAVDPIFTAGALPSRHPRKSAFTNAVRSELVLDDDGNSTGLDVAGHAVAFDATRNSWYCDIAVDTGAAYTPMIRLALARWQPDSLAGLEISNAVTTQIISLEPGRTLTIVRGHGSLKSVQLSGYSYRVAANVLLQAPGTAEMQVERRDKSIADETLGWQRVGAPVHMDASTGSDGLTTWTARDVQLPSDGRHRVVVTQYEKLPAGDDRVAPAQADDTSYSLLDPGRNYRLVHQDIVEV